MSNRDVMSLSLEQDNTIYIFIDDDKGSSTGRKNNMMGMLCRSLEKLDCNYFQLLTKQLCDSKAFSWHSSGPNREGLHYAHNMRVILKTLEKCQSRLFTFRRSEEQLDINNFRESLERYFETIPQQLQIFWPIKNVQARLLFWTIIVTIESLGRCPWKFSKPKRIIFFVDRMSYFPNDAMSISPVEASPARTCDFLRFRLHCHLTMYSLPIRVDK